MSLSNSGRPPRAPVPRVIALAARAKREGWRKEVAHPRWLKFARTYPEEQGVVRYAILFAQPGSGWRVGRMQWACDAEASGPAGTMPLTEQPVPIPDLNTLRPRHRIHGRCRAS